MSADLPRRFQAEGVEILERARELVEFGWCQGSDARDAGHASVAPWSEEAIAWSLLGALVAAADLPSEPPGPALAPLRLALSALAELIEEPLLAAWNDAPGRTQAEVARTLEAARSLCSEWVEERS